MTDNDWFHIAHDGRGAAVLYIHGEIPSNAVPFLDALRDIPAPAELDVYVNCMGGDPFTAMSIHDKLRDLVGKGCTVRAHVEGVAASSAALIVAGTNRRAPACDSRPRSPGQPALITQARCRWRQAPRQRDRASR